MNFFQLFLGLFVKPTIDRMTANHADAKDHISSALAIIDTASDLALAHDKKTQAQIQALTNTITAVTATDVQVQQKAAELRALANAISSIGN